MRDAVICTPLRTAVGRFGGGLRDVPASELGATVVRELVARTGLDPSEVDEVILGHCFPSSEAPAIGRVVALDAGLPVSVTGIQLDRRCGSGLQAVVNAALLVQTGACELVIAGGVESMSNAVHYSTRLRWGARLGDATMHDSLTRGRVTAGGANHPVPGGMVETAENLRREYGISREEQDRFALRSHRRAVAAQQRGLFDEEIVPVPVRGHAGQAVFDADEHPRSDTTLEGLSALVPVMAADDPGATVTAGNASGQNDAAAACIVTDLDNARRLGLRPMLRLVAWAVAGVAPGVMGVGPVGATAKALALAGLTLSEMDLIELNEAFAAQVLACTREWKLDEDGFERLNVNGSGISLGHPVGATGARILATLAYEMARREARYALETLCIGGGQGIAAVLERVVDR
jgi:acetyl-CoA C-acetyltransferase